VGIYPCPLWFFHGLGAGDRRKRLYTALNSIEFKTW